MSFTLINICFLITTLLIFYAVRKHYRKYVLLIASAGYCFYYSRVSLAYIIGIAFVVYLLGRAIEHFSRLSRERLKKAAYYLGLFLLIGQFVLLKEVTGRGMLSLIGLSFFSFQMIAYLVDVYGKKTEATGNYFDILLSFLWFPKLFSGPVEKVQSITKQLEEVRSFRLFAKDNLYNCLIYILYGFFCKLVLADRISNHVNIIFGQPEAFSSAWLILGSLLYTMQIYFDFAGYSNIVIGISKLFGIDLVQNFNVPYAAENISDFWGRWHISLSSWLREYIYIPLGGNRKGKMRKWINMLVVFLICGFWHGRGLSFIFWGMLHGAYSILNGIFKDKGIKWIISGYSGRIITFAEVSFAWIFFKASSLRTALFYVSRMLTVRKSDMDFYTQGVYVQMTVWDVSIILIGMIIVGCIELVSYKKKMEPVRFLSERSEILKAVLIYVFVISILVFGIYGNTSVSEFIYMKF